MENSSSNQGKDVKQKAKATAADAADKIKSTAKGAAGTVASEAAGYADQAKESAAGEVKNVAAALRTAADEMRSGSPQERTFSQIADGLADASDAVRDKDLGEMVGSLNEFAKRNPAVFLGGAALIGFAATRFAKASGASRSGPNRRSRGYDNVMDPVPAAGRGHVSTTGDVESPVINNPSKGDIQ